MATSCDLNAPRCTTEVLRVRFHGSRGGVFVGHRPPRDPGDPPLIDIYILIEVLHLYRCVTHTPCLGQGGAVEDEVKMRMKGEWKWNDLEDEMKNYLTRTRRGERKRGRREHQHHTPGPERANPERAREKKSGGSTDTEQDQRRGGKDESAWTNLTQRKPTNTSARDGANLPGEGRTHEIGDQWGLVDETTKN